ncbi:MAG: alkaline phosphatase family protein [Vicinamibacterales bacterium]|nr:alkaline phosphatase family protein [Vicinamibacterales bacterium]
MQYLRMLTNSMIGGALVGAYVVVLVLQLNPGIQRDEVSIVPLAFTWWSFYGVHAAAFFYGLIVLRQMFAVEVRSPGWISLRLLAAFGTLAVCLSAVVTWLNLRGFRAVLGPDAAGRMTDGAVFVSVCAAICMGIAVVQQAVQRRRGITATVFAAALIASFAGPIVLRGPGATLPPAGSVETPPFAVTPSTARVTMILFDGATLDFIAPGAASGRFPNLGRLLETGAVLHLATLRPTQPAPVWTAVATGKLPYKTSVYSAARYAIPGSSSRIDLLPDFCFAQSLVRFGFLVEEEHTSEELRARPMWELLGRYGITTGVIDWPLTYPARMVNGYTISDEFLRRDNPSVLASLGGEALLAWPPEAVDIAREARLRAAPEATAALVAQRSIARQPGEGQAPQMSPVAADAVAEQLALALSASRPAQFTAVRYPGIDAVGHYYLRYAVPRAFGDVSDQERRQYGRVLEEYYTYIDGIVGRAMTALGPDDLLLVVSGFGMEPISLSKRTLERLTGDADLSGSHERAPDGFMMAFGHSVGKGNFPRASVVDVAPTVLYFLGLPIARDLDGYARTDIFTASFTEQRPITFIPYYER